MECPNRELLHVDLDSSEMILSPIRLVRESKTVVDSGFHALDSGHRTPDSRYGIPDSLSLELGFRILILIVSGISDSKAQDRRFLKQKFSRFRNLDSLTWGEIADHFSSKKRVQTKQIESGFVALRTDLREGVLN